MRVIALAMLMSLHTTGTLELAQAFSGRFIEPEVFVSMAYHESRFDRVARNPVSTACGILQVIRKWHPGVDCYNVHASVWSAERDIKLWSRISRSDPLAHYNEGRRLTGRGRSYATKVRKTAHSYASSAAFVEAYWLDGCPVLGTREGRAEVLQLLREPVQEPSVVSVSPRDTAVHGPG